jgi:FixJ family two-component response regulator
MKPLARPLVHVVDDDEALRTGVARLLQAEGYEVRVHASAGDYLLSPPMANSACLVLDISMPGPSGLELQESLRRFPVALPVVFLTGAGDIESSVRAMKAGAVDFLTKPVRPEDLLRAVKQALDRHNATIDRRELIERARERHGALSPRERAVFDHVVAGGHNKVIARALGITERTVKMHRAHMMEKMGAGSLAELVQAAALLEREVI